jgi:hypothetical protein
MYARRSGVVIIYVDYGDVYMNTYMAQDMYGSFDGYTVYPEQPFSSPLIFSMNKLK